VYAAATDRSTGCVTPTSGSGRLRVRLDQPNNLSCSGHPPFFLLGKDPLAINPNIQRSRRAHFDIGWNLQLPFDIFLQADRLSLDVASEETTSDLNPHDSPLINQILMSWQPK